VPSASIVLRTLSLDDLTQVFFPQRSTFEGSSILFYRKFLQKHFMESYITSSYILAIKKSACEVFKKMFTCSSFISGLEGCTFRNSCVYVTYKSFLSQRFCTTGYITVLQRHRAKLLINHFIIRQRGLVTDFSTLY